MRREQSRGPILKSSQVIFKDFRKKKLEKLRTIPNSQKVLGKTWEKIRKILGQATKLS